MEEVLARVRKQGGFAFCGLIRRCENEPWCAEIAYDMAWEQLHSGSWHEVDTAWRDGYALACLYWARELRREGKNVEAMRMLDMGLMMGGMVFRSELNSTISQLQGCSYSRLEPRPLPHTTGEHTHTEDLPSGSLQGEPVKSLSLPSIQKFLVEHFEPRVPAVLTDTMTHWPAMLKWKDFSYFETVAGGRTVPVEVGETYLADGWKQELVTMSQFLYRMHDTADVARRTYLAQHPLFEQIPELQRDIMIPDYCACGDGELHSINAWFGPTGTVTPLHHDPHHNLLAQVVGSKYIRLYPPGVSEQLYPFREPMLQNSSQVDLDKPDYERFPRAKDLVFTDCVLTQGEMLYIPPKWWHYVKALSPSFSVSFWWRDELSV